jgi:hypothetical protein
MEMRENRKHIVAARIIFAGQQLLKFEEEAGQSVFDLPTQLYLKLHELIIVNGIRSNKLHRR